MLDSLLSTGAQRLHPDTIVPDYPDWLHTHFPTWPWDAAHLRLIQRHLDAVTRGEITKLMIFVPPRHMKSESTTIRYAAWRLERDPTLRVITAAYNQTLANRFSRRTRRIVAERVPLSTERTAVEDWETTAGGGLRAVGVGGGITGVGGNLILIDDPVKSRREADSPTYRDHVWDWYTDDLYTRRERDRSGREAAMILIMTRWHPDDLAGRILDSPDGPNWTVLSLPAIAGDNDLMGRQPGEPLWPAEYGLDALEAIRTAVDERTWNALYQQTPTQAGGAIFLADWWHLTNRFDPTAPNATRIAGHWISWDTAMVDHDEAAYSAAVVGELLHDRTLYTREVYRDRLTFPELANAIERVAHDYYQRGTLREVVIEDRASGTSALQTLRAHAPHWLRSRLVAWQPSGSKEQRAMQAAVWARNGMVWLPEPCDTVPWLADFERELLSFPQSQHMDQVDAFAQLILYLEPYLQQGWDRRSRQAREAA